MHTWYASDSIIELCHLFSKCYKLRFWSCCHWKWRPWRIWNASVCINENVINLHFRLTIWWHFILYKFIWHSTSEVLAEGLMCLSLIIIRKYKAITSDKSFHFNICFVFFWSTHIFSVKFHVLKIRYCL